MTLSDNIKWLYRATKGVRARVVGATLLGITSVVCSLLFVYLSKLLIDLAIRDHSTESLNRYIAMLVGVMLLQLVSVTLKNRLNSLNSTTMMNYTRVKLFDTVMRSEWSGRELFHTGDIVSRIEGDTRTVSEAICVTIPSILITIIQFLASFRFLQILDPKLAWILVFIMPLSLVISKRYLLKMRELTQSIRSTDSEVQSHIQEQVQHRTTINTLGNGESSVERLREKSLKLLRQTLRSIDYSLYTRAVVQLGFTAGYVVTFVWGVKGLSSGAITFGVVTAFLQLVSQIQRPVVELSSQISTTAKCSASVERIAELEALQQEDDRERITLSGEVGVEIKDLTFKYSDGGDRNILENFSYNFAPNSMHVIVGQTGVGKSTLIRIMLGLLKPNSGSIKIYNKSQSESCSPATRSNFVYVPQGNTLMSGTIRENLLLANPTASDDEIQAALHCAVADFVYQLPQGLDSICGERGAGLSEGEAQRVAIARGLLQSGNIMLLDEPTSALDSETEQRLIDRLANYSESRTLIMVTHRDTAAQLCASVVRL